jgi:tryptophan synthase beta chain
MLLQDRDGQVSRTHSVSAGLDYPAVGPEHAMLAAHGRVEYTSATDADAIHAFHVLAETEGILPALEAAHAVAEAVRRAPRLGRRMVLLVNLSGRGDKDVESVLAWDHEHGEEAEHEAELLVHPAIRKWGWRRGEAAAEAADEEETP